MSEIRYFRTKPKVVQVFQVDQEHPELFCIFVGDSEAWNDDDKLGAVPVMPGMGYDMVEHGDYVVKHDEGQFEIMLESELESEYEEIR